MSLKTLWGKLSLRQLSLRSRLVVIFVLIFGATTLTFSIFLYYFLNKSLLQDFDDALYNYSVDVSQIVELIGRNTPTNTPLRVEEGKIFPFPSGTALILVRDLEGNHLIQSGRFGGVFPEFKNGLNAIMKGADSYYETIDDANHIPNAEAYSYRVITFPVDTKDGSKYLLQIAVPMGTFETQLAQLKLILYFGIPAVLIVAIISGLFVSSRALRPVQEIISKAQKIDALQLSERVPIPKSNDEIRKLADTLNSMLERIENAFASQERFVADASHQLLTPLTIMKGEFELQYKKTQSIEKKEFIQSGLQEIDHLTKIVRDMLLLARIDAGTSAMNLTDVYLDEILLEVIADLKKVSDQKNIPIRFDIQEFAERSAIQGDHDFLYNLFYNLTENAIKYSSENSPIEIKLEWHDAFTLFSIEDHGKGIPLSVRPFLFQRFSRGDTSSRSKKGHGLGLAIAQKIAELHHSEILLIEKSTPGCLFRLQFEHQSAHPLSS